MKVKPGYWYALVRGPRNLPVLFHYASSAKEARDPDEHLVRVRVTNAGRRRRRKARR